MIPLRIGILGAARIAPMAVIGPARELPEAVVVAVAARDPLRARAFADRHGILRVHPTYEALLADPEVEAVYIPLPPSHHGIWSIRALEHGKHVLCEKPFAANADEARRMAAAARAAGRVLMEAFHWRYHPLAARMREIVTGGELGRIGHLEAHLCLPHLRRRDIRWRLDLAGGATMDLGCYPISIIRFLAGAEPEVVAARASLASPGVDRAMTAAFRFADGRTARMTCALLSAAAFRISARVQGDAGSLAVFNPVAPQFLHWLRVRTPRGTRIEHLRSEGTYTHQLRAFVAAVREGTPVPTGPDDAIANMEVIDAVYLRAGLVPRSPAAGPADPALPVSGAPAP